MRAEAATVEAAATVVVPGRVVGTEEVVEKVVAMECKVAKMKNMD